ncbi:MAG: hypothetical protein AAF808_11635, partial [Cyanobacteria bacterium P01_D01_bin.2]
DSVELFGEPDEEIQIEISQADLLTLGISPQTLAQQIAASDAKVSTGCCRRAAPRWKLWHRWWQSVVTMSGD